MAPRACKGDASRATRKRRSGGPDGQASAVPAISAPGHRDTASGTKARRAPFPASLSGPAARFFEGQPLATGEEPGGSIVSVRIVQPLARGAGGSLPGRQLRVFGPGAAVRRRVADAGRDTRVARDRRWRAMMAGSDTVPDEVGPAARSGRCVVGRRLRSAKVPASPGWKTYPVVKHGAWPAPEASGLRSGRIAFAWVTALAPDASLFITALPCGQSGFGVASGFAR